MLLNAFWMSVAPLPLCRLDQTPSASCNKIKCCQLQHKLDDELLHELHATLYENMLATPAAALIKMAVAAHNNAASSKTRPKPTHPLLLL